MLKYLLPCFLLGFLACAPTKAYRGLERSKEELSWVYFTTIEDISLSNMSINGFKVGLLDWGANVAAGENEFSYTSSYRHGYCDSYKDDAPSSVLCQTRHRRCNGKFSSEAGQRYKILVNSSSAFVTREIDNYPVGQATCTAG